jgi:hypothetical protein
MKTFALLLVALLVVRPSAMAASDDTKAFTDHFYDDANIPSYVASVDDLIVAGEAKIYASIEDEKKDSQSPRAKTPNGILMVYTVTHTPKGVLVHFSTSRAPYLPMPLGKHIVGLFMARSGWPKPMMFAISDRQVFHAVWMMPEAKFAEIQKGRPELNAKTTNSAEVKSAFLKGLLRSAELNDQPPGPGASSGRGSS